jgi:hypothetical protein
MAWALDVFEGRLGADVAWAYDIRRARWVGWWCVLLTACGQYTDFDAAEFCEDRILVECVNM